MPECLPEIRLSTVPLIVSNSNLTIPNLLSLLRIAAAPFIVVSMIEGRFDVALFLFISASCTDILDGYLARRFHWTSKLGAFLDPAGDKLLLVSIYVTLTFRSLPATFHIPAWLTILVLSRDVLIVGISLIITLAQGQSKFPPSWLGKATTFVLIVDASSALLANIRPLPEPALVLIVWTAAAVTVASGFDYIIRIAMPAAADSETHPEKK